MCTGWSRPGPSLTLSSLASISTTSVSTSSMVALQQVTHESTAQRLGHCTCWPRVLAGAGQGSLGGTLGSVSGSWGIQAALCSSCPLLSCPRVNSCLLWL